MEGKKELEVDIVIKVKEWANSSEGQGKIQGALDLSSRAAVMFDEACQIDPSILHLPMSV